MIQPLAIIIFHSKLPRFLSSMAPNFEKVLCPPREVHGMTELDRQKFRKSIAFPCVQVPSKLINRLVGLPTVRELILDRMPRLKPFRDAELADTKLLLLDPDKFGEATEERRHELAEQIGKQIDEPAPDIGSFNYQMEYEDWDMRRCMQAVLPEGVEFSGFEQCGHIAHLNLREKQLPFRFVIGQILLDKTPGCRIKTVINKLDMLNNQFRVMNAELLAGKANFLTEVVEDGIRYKLDYSKVFWNSRLSTVHKETVQRFDQNSVVFDVFAGVGPFVLPAIGQRKIKRAFANDLNPVAIDYLRESMKVNKISEEKVETFVLDGQQFIREVVPEKICAILNSNYDQADNNINSSNQTAEETNFHLVMNLPGHSADHLPLFRGFLSKYPDIRPRFVHCPFWIHCHFFVKANDDLPLAWYREEAAKIVRAKMGIPDLEIEELKYNRKVASRKEMFCARFRLPAELAFSSRKASSVTEEPLTEEHPNGNVVIDAASVGDEEMTTSKDEQRKRAESGAAHDEEVSQANGKRQRIL